MGYSECKNFQLTKLNEEKQLSLQQSRLAWTTCLTYFAHIRFVKKTDNFSSDRAQRLVFKTILACLASVSVWFWSKERCTRVKDLAKNGAFYFLALVSFFARSKAKIPFLGLSLLRNQMETLAEQANKIHKTLSFFYFSCTRAC